MARSNMGGVLPLPCVVATLIACFGIRGCDALMILRPIQCPYFNNATQCQPENNLIACNATSCPGTSTCCEYECSGMHCVSRPSMCPGDLFASTASGCSAADQTVHCKDSEACGKQASCCENQCGGTQCLALNKPHTCPPFKPKKPKTICPMVASAFETGCASDTNCVGTQKCCGTTCFGNQCTSVFKSGHCPAVQRGIFCPRETKKAAANQCEGDYGCGGNEKCCKHACTGLRCLAPVKQGSCPTFILAGCPVKKNESSVANKCSEDFNCTGHNKCCSNPCTGDTCQQAVKPGSCPALMRGEGKCVAPTNATKANQCDGDYECSDGLKCCTQVCTGRRCVAPVGICPPVGSTTAGSAETCDEECSTSLPCTGGKACCTTACGGQACF